MDAIILAAGIGSRLKQLTGEKPKCMVNVNGRTIIEHQISALLSTTVERIHVVGGFAFDVLSNHLESRFGGSDRISLIRNAEYESTNNMYSLRLCAHAVRDREFLLMNGDVVFDASILRGLIDAGGNRICVDVSTYNDESMKVECDSLGRIKAIAKTVPRAQAFGCSIDVYRFDVAGGAALMHHTDEIILRQGRRREWTEVALDDLFKTRTIDATAFDIAGRDWVEIDNLDDLANAEARFGRSALDWPAIRAAFVDMDGTLYNGERPIPGAAAFVQELRNRVPAVHFLSNNSSRSHADYIGKLHAMGITAEKEEIRLSSDAAGSWLHAAGIRRVYVVGTRALVETLAGYGVVNDAEDPQAVLVGYDTELTYEKIKRAALFLNRESVRFFATHFDVVCPTELGPIPDAGALLHLFNTATKRTPEQVFGKPNPVIVADILRRGGLSGRECLFVGDRVYTDYELARACDAIFLAVLSGDSSRKDYETLNNVIVFPSVGHVFDRERDLLADLRREPLPELKAGTGLTAV
jgi:HAD superfamily hydrolase (TIGR01450 family)